MLAIGLMSGTSMDGVDAALLELSDDGAILADLGHASLDYTRETKLLLKVLEYSVRNAKGDLALARADFPQNIDIFLKNYCHHEEPLGDVVIQAVSGWSRPLGLAMTDVSLDDAIRHSTDLHIECVKRLLQKTGRHAHDITIIGYHGQTVYHSPTHKITLSVGDPQHMADQLGINVIHDFRREDVAAGGQGAPFAPLYHYALACRDNTIPIGIINCGGIANVTIIPNDNESDMIAFDTGPGNGLIDLLVRQRTNGLESMDRDGAYGKQGVVNEEALAALYNASLVKDGQNYVWQLPPKSLDIGDMQLVPEISSLNLNDACATLETFTATTIVDGIRLVSGHMTLPKRWVLCGGGWKNPVIRSVFEDELCNHLGDDTIVQTADEAGWNMEEVSI